MHCALLKRDIKQTLQHNWERYTTGIKDRSNKGIGTLVQVYTGCLDQEGAFGISCLPLFTVH